MKKLFYILYNYIRQTDQWLWLFCLGLSGFSAVLLTGIVSSGIMPGLTMHTVKVQMIASALGAVSAIILSKFDYHTLSKLWKLHAPVAYTFVLMTFIIGTGTAERQGDKSWIALPGMSMTIQPAEFLKISFILTFAYHLFCVRDEVNRPQNVLLLCMHGAVPVLLIHFQGDDGSALVFASIFVCMIFAAGLSWKYIIPAIVAMIAAAPLIWFFLLNDYQRQRFMILWDPAANPLGNIYQQYNAKLAMGSGQIWGKGIFTTNHKYVPAEHTDFIFAFIGESLGFVGCLAVVLVLTLLCVKTLVNANLAEDSLGRYICVGVFAMLAFQIIINIGMCLSLLPVIGITLPFLSSGGSSVLASYMGLGLALSVYMHTSKNLFSN